MKRVFALLAILPILVGHGPSRAEAADNLTMNVLYLDGKSGYVQLPPNAFDALTEATVEAWVKWERFNNWAHVFDFGREKNGVLVQNEETSSTLHFTIYDRKKKGHRVKAEKAVTAGTWYHIAAVCGPGGMEFYVNGRLVDSDRYDGGLDEAAGGQNYVGRSNWPKDELFQGHIAEFRVWGRRRSGDEIAAQKDRLLTGREPGLVAYWHFNQSEGASAPDAGPSKHAASLVGGARIVSVPAIARFLTPGELEKAAEESYRAAADAFGGKGYEAAAGRFREALSYVENYRDAIERAAESQRLADEAAALKLYTSGQAFMAQKAYIDAYRAFKAALEKVPNFQDAPALMQEALTRGTYSVGLFVLSSGKLRDSLTPAPESEPGRLKRLWSAIEKAGRDDLLERPEDLERIEGDLHARLRSALERGRPDYVRLIDRREMQSILTDKGVNPRQADGVQVIQACRGAAIPVVVVGEVVTAYVRSSNRTEEKNACTVKREAYTDDKGKKRSREVEKKWYKYYEAEGSVEMACEMRYRILDTGTGRAMDEGTVSAKDEDQVKYVNWNRYDGVDPDDLRVRSGDGFKRLPSGERRLFDARSTLKGKWAMLEGATDQMGGELAVRILKALETYSPGTVQSAR
jgi:tetratricopeptide (TPR) repeat protein